MLNPTVPPQSALGQFADVNGIRMYFERSGVGPALLLLHGGSLSCRVWDPYRAEIASHFDLITPDSRGHSRSNNPPNTLSYPMMADDVVGLIRVLGLDRPLIAGYSDGGQIALDLAVRYPGLARAYVVGAASYQISPEPSEDLRAMGIDGPGVVDFGKVEQALADFVPIWREHHDAFQGPDYWKRLVVQLSTLWCTPIDYSTSDLVNVRDPVLIFSPDRDGLIPLDQQLDMFRNIPNAELAIIPGANHMTALERPGVFTTIVLDYLMRH